MKRSADDLSGFSIGATDGELGKLSEFYFDDETWTVRYIIVKTGNWFSGRKVLISPEAITNIDWENEVIQTNLTTEQIKNSPDIDTDKPVSRQEEIRLYQYYPWTSYWGGGLWAGGIGTTGMAFAGPSAPMEEAIRNDAMQHEEAKGDRHLRSTDTVDGYNIHATDGDIGDVEDFIIDDNTWKIEYLVVDTGNWLPGKKVIISPKWINEVSWEDSSVYVDLTVDAVKGSPEYDKEKLYSESYHTDLYSHYNKEM